MLQVLTLLCALLGAAQHAEHLTLQALGVVRLSLQSLSTQGLADLHVAAQTPQRVLLQKTVCAELLNALFLLDLLECATPERQGAVQELLADQQLSLLSSL